LCFVFRNFPLTKIHPHAYHAAIAAETADSHGRFWEMHRYLLKHQDTLSDDNLMLYASKLSIDTERFGSQFLDRVFAPRVDKDIRSGEMSGVTGTPTFFINGRYHDSSGDLETLLDAIAESTDKQVAS
jgi:protein-disulfide isomerase